MLNAQSISIGGLINKKKSVNHYSSLISLVTDSSNSFQHLPLTFKTLINLVAFPEEELTVRATNLHDAKDCVLFSIISR